MRALTVRQPWAGLIAQGVKTTENRSWRTHYRGALLIHAGTRWDPTASDYDPADFGARGVIVACAQLVDVHRDAGCCRPWGASTGWHWVLADIEALAEPVPASGALGLWRPDLLAMEGR